jgi:hypothetical protein
MRAPFRAGVFDAVITPWLLDVLGEPADTALRHVNRLLADDGVWLHQGSIAFSSADPAARLTLEELLEVASVTGFGPFEVREQCVPYMDCPESRHGRRESVVTLRADKHTHVPPESRHQHLPNWIVEGREPIPALPAFQTQAMTTRMHAFIMTLIDGKRSLKDLARTLEEQQLMGRRDAETALRGFLTSMFEEAGQP